MSTTNNPKKDPLSSLFGPNPMGGAADGVNDTPEPGHIRPVRPVSRPIPPPTPAAPPAAPAAAGPDPRALAKALAKAAAAKAGPPPAAPKPPAPAAAAKPVARGAAAAPPPVKKLSAAEALELARKQEAERAAAAAAPPPAPPPAFSPAPAVAPAAVAAPVAAPAPAAAPVAAPAPAPAPVATPAPVAAPPVLTEDQLGEAVQSVLGSALPGAQVYVANAVFASDRKALAALWRSHRARFRATHQMEYAIGASQVLHLLATAPADQLALAQGVTDKGEFLLWVDLAHRTVVTAFANPRQLITGW